MKHTDNEIADTKYLDAQRRELAGDPLHAAVLIALRPKNCAGAELCDPRLRGTSSMRQPSQPRQKEGCVEVVSLSGSTPAHRQTIELLPADVIALEAL